VLKKENAYTATPTLHQFDFFSFCCQLFPLPHDFANHKHPIVFFSTVTTAREEKLLDLIVSNHSLPWPKPLPLPPPQLLHLNQSPRK
jgi:hypothetical protein